MLLRSTVGRLFRVGISQPRPLTTSTLRRSVSTGGAPPSAAGFADAIPLGPVQRWDARYPCAFSLRGSDMALWRRVVLVFHRCISACSAKPAAGGRVPATVSLICSAHQRPIFRSRPVAGHKGAESWPANGRGATGPAHGRWPSAPTTAPWQRRICPSAPFRRSVRSPFRRGGVCGVCGGAGCAQAAAGPRWPVGRLARDCAVGAGRNQAHGVLRQGLLACVRQAGGP